MRAEPSLGEKALRRLDLHRRRQAPVGRYIADFAIPNAKPVVEVDGRLHEQPEQQLHDAKRDAWLASPGYRVLQFSTAEVLNGAEGVAEQVRRAALSPPSPTLPPSWGTGK